MYLALTVIFLVGACALGATLGALAPSRPAALLLGVASGVGLALFGNPVPPSSYAWMGPNSQKVFVLAAVSLLLLVGLWFANLNRGVFKVAGAAAVVVALATTYLLTGIPKAVQRDRTDAGICRSDEDVRVCVWPGDEFYFDTLSAMGKRFTELSRYLGIPATWTIAEKGLTIPEHKATVTPLGLGEGMWFSAEELAFVLLNDQTDQSDQCDYASMNKAELEALSQKNSALVDVMSGFIYAGSRPKAAKSSNATLDARTRDTAAKVKNLPPDEQLQWIEKTLREVGAC